METLTAVSTDTLVFRRHFTTNHSLMGIFIGGAKLNVKDGFEPHEPGRVMSL
jgi:hypothetical protein